MTQLSNVVRDVNEWERRLATKAVKNYRAVLDDDVGVGELPGTFRRFLQAADFERRFFSHLPFCSQRMSKLVDLDCVERLFEDQQSVPHIQTREYLCPRII